jgi:hypothetical protein
MFGVIAFLTPVRHEGGITILMATLSDWLTTHASSRFLPSLSPKSAFSF